MLKSGKICTLFLAAGLITAMSIPALAEGKRPAALDGNTTISIFQARQDPGNVSFTVPLYVTMAVYEGEKAVRVPDNYSIINESSKVSSQGVRAFDIAVVEMKFQKMNGSSYNTVEKQDVSGDNDILFQIGNLTMPAMNKAGEKEVKLRTEGSQFLEDSSAANYETSKFKKITVSTPSNALNLKLNGQVSGKALLDLDYQGSVAQFHVTYIISPLIDGDSLGYVYAGNDYYKAGSPVIEDE